VAHARDDARQTLYDFRRSQRDTWRRSATSFDYLLPIASCRSAVARVCAYPPNDEVARGAAHFLR
jgi:hypothetical protein